MIGPARVVSTVPRCGPPTGSPRGGGGLAALVLLFGLAAGLIQETGSSAAAVEPEETGSTSAGGEALQVRPAAGPIEIDGSLDEAAWSEAAVAPVRWEYLPGDAVPAPVATEALVTYDQDYLYVAFRAHDPEPERIRANLMDRDSVDTLVQDDHVVFMVDTFNDQRRAYQFRVNPLGVQADAFNSDVDQTEDWSFDLIWDAAARITGDGYVVEIAVPVKQLRFPRTGGEMTWRMNFERSWPRSERHRISEHRRDRNRSCYICQFSTVTGFEGLESGRNVELDPTLTVTRTDRRADFPGGELEDGAEELEPGLTARWGVTPNVSLLATVNPDFSQVEADVAQLAVNERFALFFPEKRPFFLEGGDVFNTPFNLVFTRSVVSPDWGVKLTGKQGKNTIGVFAVRDEVNSLLIPGNQGSRFAFVDDEVDTAVLRYRRDVGKRSSLGLLYAGREGDGYHNRVAGLDGFFQLTERDEVRFQYARSDTLYPAAIADRFGQPAGSFDGDALRVVYRHVSREWFWQLFYQDRSPELRADAGFEPRVDNRAKIVTLQRRFWGGEDSWWNRASLGTYLRSTDDYSGRLTDEDLQVWGDIAGPLQLYLNPGVSRSKRFFAGTLYEELDDVWLYGEIQPGGRVKLTGFFEIAETIDFANNQPADQVLLQPGVEVKAGRHVNAKLDHTRQVLDVDGGELFTADLSQLRLVYNFNVRSFVRAIFQYQRIDRDPALYSFPVDPSTEELFSQLLFSYKLNAKTVLFVGYSDNRLGLEQQNGPNVERIGLTQTDRTFFVKFGYAWVL